MASLKPRTKTLLNMAKYNKHPSFSKATRKKTADLIRGTRKLLGKRGLM